MDMFRKRYRSSSPRVASLLRRWWVDLRFFWYGTNKFPLFVVGIVGVMIGALGLLTYSLSVEKLERRALMCLALNVYFEARGEPEVGQYAVAEVTMNRLASRHYPKTVCGVVYQKGWDRLRKRYVGAFSWTELDTHATPKGEEWARARKVAEEVYYKRRAPSLSGALHYHADYVVPRWSTGKTPIARIGSHIFYE